ncbi:MAG: hypothetical protein MHM6MM_001035 [Cercozoa sp. M6MM]
MPKMRQGRFLSAVWLLLALVSQFALSQQQARPTEAQNGECSFDLVLLQPGASDRQDTNFVQLNDFTPLVLHFSKPVIPLGSDWNLQPYPFDNDFAKDTFEKIFAQNSSVEAPFAVLPTVEGKVRGRLRWVTTYIARIDPIERWPRDSELQIQLHPDLRSVENCTLDWNALDKHVDFREIRYKTPSLSLHTQSVSSEKMKELTEGGWRSRLPSSDAHELPKDGVIRISVNSRDADGSLVAKALKLDNESVDSLDAVEVDVVEEESAHSMDRVLVEIRGLGAHFDRNQQRQLLLPIGSKISYRDGPTSRLLELTLSGIVPFQFEWLPVRQLSVSHVRWMLFVRHGLAHEYVAGLLDCLHAESTEHKESIRIDDIEQLAPCVLRLDVLPGLRFDEALTLRVDDCVGRVVDLVDESLVNVPGELSLAEAPYWTRQMQLQLPARSGGAFFDGHSFTGLKLLNPSSATKSKLRNKNFNVPVNTLTVLAFDQTSAESVLADESQLRVLMSFLAHVAFGTQASLETQVRHLQELVPSVTVEVDSVRIEELSETSVVSINGVMDHITLLDNEMSQKSFIRNVILSSSYENSRRRNNDACAYRTSLLSQSALHAVAFSQERSATLWLPLDQSNCPGAGTSVGTAGAVFVRKAPSHLWESGCHRDSAEIVHISVTNLTAAAAVTGSTCHAYAHVTLPDEIETEYVHVDWLVNTATDVAFVQGPSFASADVHVNRLQLSFTTDRKLYDKNETVYLSGFTVWPQESTQSPLHVVAVTHFLCQDSCPDTRVVLLEGHLGLRTGSIQVPVTALPAMHSISLYALDNIDAELKDALASTTLTLKVADPRRPTAFLETTVLNPGKYLEPNEAFETSLEITSDLGIVLRRNCDIKVTIPVPQENGTVTTLSYETNVTTPATAQIEFDIPEDTWTRVSQLGLNVQVSCTGPTGEILLESLSRPIRVRSFDVSIRVQDKLLPRVFVPLFVDVKVHDENKFEQPELRVVWKAVDTESDEIRETSQVTTCEAFVQDETVLKCIVHLHQDALQFNQEWHVLLSDGTSVASTKVPAWSPPGLESSVVTSVRHVLDHSLSLTVNDWNSETESFFVNLDFLSYFEGTKVAIEVSSVSSSQTPQIAFFDLPSEMQDVQVRARFVASPTTTIEGYTVPTQVHVSAAVYVPRQTRTLGAGQFAADFDASFAFVSTVAKTISLETLVKASPVENESDETEEDEVLRASHASVVEPDSVLEIEVTGRSNMVVFGYLVDASILELEPLPLWKLSDERNAVDMTAYTPQAQSNLDAQLWQASLDLYDETWRKRVQTDAWLAPNIFAATPDSIANRRNCPGEVDLPDSVVFDEDYSWLTYTGNVNHTIFDPPTPPQCRRVFPVPVMHAKRRLAARGGGAQMDEPLTTLPQMDSAADEFEASGVGSGTGPSQVRKNFATTTLIASTVLKEDSAVLRVKLPENLGTFKLRLFALFESFNDVDTRPKNVYFADGNPEAASGEPSVLLRSFESQLTVKKPLSITPLFPLFARHGDSFQCGGIITGNGTVELTLESENLEISATSVTAEIVDSARVTSMCQSDVEGDISVVLDASNSKGSTDAMLHQLSVVPVQEAVIVATSMVVENEWKEGLDLPFTDNTDTARIEVSAGVGYKTVSDQLLLELLRYVAKLVFEKEQQLIDGETAALTWMLLNSRITQSVHEALCEPYESECYLTLKEECERRTKELTDERYGLRRFDYIWQPRRADLALNAFVLILRDMLSEYTGREVPGMVADWESGVYQAAQETLPRYEEDQLMPAYWVALLWTSIPHKMEPLVRAFERHVSLDRVKDMDLNSLLIMRLKRRADAEIAGDIDNNLRRLVRVQGRTAYVSWADEQGQPRHVQWQALALLHMVRETDNDEWQQGCARKARATRGDSNSAAKLASTAIQVVSLLTFDRAVGNETPSLRVIVQFASDTWLDQHFAQSGQRENRLIDWPDNATQGELIDIDATGTGQVSLVLALIFVPPVSDHLRARDRGLSVTRVVQPIEPKVGAPTDAVASNTMMRITIQVASVDTLPGGVVLTDLLPAGLEPLQDVAAHGAAASSFDSMLSHSVFRERFVYKNKVVWRTSYLTAGTHQVSYLAFSNIPGSYVHPPAHAYAAEQPELMGTSATNGTFNVLPIVSN